MAGIEDLKLDNSNFAPTEGQKALPVYVDKYNDLVDYIDELNLIDDLTFTGSITGGGGTASLVNDERAPGNTKFYGTNPAGTKGWRDAIIPTGTAIANQIPVWTGSTEIKGPTGLVFNENKLGIGLTAPLQRLHIKTPNADTDAVIGNFAHDYYGIVVESEDAILGLVSEDEGGHGSGVSLIEINSGVLQDLWHIGRFSSSSDSRIQISYGSDPDYAVNNRVLDITTDYKMFMITGAAKWGIATSNVVSTLTLGNSNSKITTDSATGADIKRIQVGGGGTVSAIRGGYINVMGIDYPSQEGNISFVAGNTGATGVGAIKFYTGNTVQRMAITNEGAISLSLANAKISTDTPTGADSKRIQIAGGGTVSSARGAYINLMGNAFPGQEGDLSLLAGNTGNTGAAGTGSVRIFTGNTEERISIANDGGVFAYSLKSGATQTGAGAATDELWTTSSHATLPDNVVLIGV